MEWRFFAAVAACVGLGGCSGGGGSPPPAPPASISFSTEQLTFTTPASWWPAASPVTTKITGTVQGTVNGTLYIIVQVNNPELVSVGNVVLVGANSGEATVTPVLPSTLANGTHTGSITIRACVNDPQCNSNQLQGSPKTIGITYTIPSNVEGNSVTPRIVTAGTAGTVILRGTNFPAGATVSFGGTAATAVTRVSSTELRASYPSLAVGAHAVVVNSGAVNFAGALVAAPQTNFGATFLPHPTSGTAHVVSLEYDAERQALLAMTLPAGEETRLFRYEFVGGQWSTPSSVTIPAGRQIRLSQDGTRLLVLRAATIPVGTHIEERDPVTLALINSTQLNASVVGESFVLTNDGNALLATRLSGSGSADQYAYAVARRQFTRLGYAGMPFATVVSGDGSRAALMSEMRYDSGTGRLTPTFGESFGFQGAEPSADLTGEKIQSGTAVLNAQLQLIGLISSSHTATVVNRAGTRLYAVEPDGANAPRLNVFDLTVPPTGGPPYPQLVQIGGPVDLPDDPGLISSPPPEMTISPDGRSVFIGGFRGIAVMPTP